MNMTTTEQRLADALRRFVSLCPNSIAADHAREALAAHDAQKNSGENIPEEIMQMEKPWHLSGSAEEYGFYHGKVAAAALVRKAFRVNMPGEGNDHA